MMSTGLEKTNKNREISMATQFAPCTVLDGPLDESRRMRKIGHIPKRVSLPQQLLSPGYLTSCQGCVVPRTSAFRVQNTT